MSDFDKAVAVWMERKYGLDPTKIRGVHFSTEQGGYCETCVYSYVALSFGYDGKTYDQELDTTPGEFVRQVAQIAKELT